MHDMSDNDVVGALDWINIQCFSTTGDKFTLTPRDKIDVAVTGPTSVVTTQSRDGNVETVNFTIIKAGAHISFLMILIYS